MVSQELDEDRRLSMDELTTVQQLLISNWQRKYYQLSDVLITSLVGLTVADTLAILAMARKQRALNVRWEASIE